MGKYLFMVLVAGLVMGCQAHLVKYTPEELEQKKLELKKNADSKVKGKDAFFDCVIDNTLAEISVFDKKSGVYLVDEQKYMTSRSHDNIMFKQAFECLKFPTSEVESEIRGHVLNYYSHLPRKVGNCMADEIFKKFTPNDRQRVLSVFLFKKRDLQNDEKELMAAAQSSCT